MTENLIPDTLIPPFFSVTLRDGSLLVGFKGSRFHAHIYQKGNSLVAHVAENVKGGDKERTETIAVNFPPGTSLATAFKRRELHLPGDTKAIFLSFDRLTDALARVVEGTCPEEVHDAFESLLAQGIKMSSISAARSTVDIPGLVRMLHLLLDWECAEPGVLARLTLDEARQTYPLNAPCFVELDGKWVLVNLRSEGVLMYPQETISEGLQVILRLTRIENLMAAPIRHRGKEVLMDEALMRQVKNALEERMA